MQLNENERVVLFDAECVLCSANAKLILKHDHRQIFLLASMQGEVGARLFTENGLDPKNPSTILVIEKNLVRKDSDAVLSIYENLKFPFNLMRIFRLVPAAFRDPIYHFIALNRYRIFGRRDTCWVPPEEYRSRLL
ncbi:DCC1-like thiol-disulfide oxidoreductase family protein [Qipengyuania sp. S6317L1]|uniref:thiol-disulfide oxidoreductase DCC family protein n=1 Tax=Qipengyuania sp. S6317L1 TaxID=2926410 RepID=UPI001FF154DB|nr:DCC1-like thiol-disulfide oxidoreductase family protein [Qipengyuania sp. S6317L1]MCK0098071.1 DCC1-like thiol-disulfide oxidoreductase family protein [Qipengyuania sp. S6317L1]